MARDVAASRRAQQQQQQQRCPLPSQHAAGAGAAAAAAAATTMARSTTASSTAAVSSAADAAGVSSSRPFRPTSNSATDGSSAAVDKANPPPEPSSTWASLERYEDDDDDEEEEEGLRAAHPLVERRSTGGGPPQQQQREGEGGQEGRRRRRRTTASSPSSSSSASDSSTPAKRRRRRMRQRVDGNRSRLGGDHDDDDADRNSARDRNQEEHDGTVATVKQATSSSKKKNCVKGVGSKWGALFAEIASDDSDSEDQPETQEEERRQHHRRQEQVVNDGDSEEKKTGAKAKKEQRRLSEVDSGDISPLSNSGNHGPTKTPPQKKAANGNVGPQDGIESSNTEVASFRRTSLEFPSPPVEGTGYSRPRNPLALMRAQQDPMPSEHRDQSLSPSPRQQTTGQQQPAMTSFETAAQTDSLWSDDDDELVENPSKPSQNLKKSPHAFADKGDADKTSTLAKYPEEVKRKLPLVKSLVDDEELHVDLGEAKLHLKPTFADPKFGPLAERPLTLGPIGGNVSINNGAGDSVDGTGREDFRVPASINRYILDYQQTGIEFMFNNVVAGIGAILGDDMGKQSLLSREHLCAWKFLNSPFSFCAGLGKTVQVISLLAALLRKTGTRLDLIEIRRRKKLVDSFMHQFTAEKEAALREGRVITSNTDVSAVGGLAWAPILVIVPPGIVKHWLTDFETWGYFAISLLQSGSIDEEANIELVRHGGSEVLLWYVGDEFGYLLRHQSTQLTLTTIFSFAFLFFFKYKLHVQERAHPQCTTINQLVAHCY